MFHRIRSHVVTALLALTILSSQAAITPALGEPGGGVRTDNYAWAGFGFYLPEGTVTRINQLGYWDQGGDGLNASHTVAIFKFAGSGMNYIEIARATIPAGEEAVLEGGYRWVQIEEVSLESNGLNGNYYVLMASHGGDAWTNGLGAGAPMNPEMGVISRGALDLLGEGPEFRINASNNMMYGGANFGYGQPSEPPTGKQAEFLNPPLKMKTKPLWFWNNATVTAEGIAEQMRKARDLDHYGGFGILPFGGNFMPKYLTEDYFDVYGVAVATARELGMNLCIYDEYGFPSGSAGAINGDGIPRFANAYPDDTIKRLDKFEADVTGPSLYQRRIPSGVLMACVAMNNETRELEDLTAAASGGNVSWQVPEGNWKVMIFMCVKDGDPNVDYLDPDACANFVKMTYQEYYNRFGDDFGPDKTIDGVFFDEPTIYRAAGRMWTAAFNDKFEAAHGFRPEIYYPALWYDIGTDTQAARSYLFGFRAELYASGFPQVIQDWCREHGGIFATGHMDQEEIVNPSNVSGDLMKAQRGQDIPGIDKIGGGRPTERFYKVVSSAARNYDKPFVMSETYGAMGNISYETIYHVAMDQYTKGVNMLIPHAVWYRDDHVTFLPELSWRNPLYSSGLPAYNRFMGRLNVMLQKEGRHVADIGMLYPIATLHGGNYLDGPLGYYEGGVAIPEADYAEVGALLSDVICRDFTFVHPEVLDERCSVDGPLIHLENAVNREQYKVFIMPGQTTISWSNLEKIKQFYDNGGKVIATRKLPEKSAEFGHDADVRRVIAEMFAPASPYPVTSASSEWASGAFNAIAATDSSMDTRWNAASGTSGNQWLEVDFGEPTAFDRTTVREAFNRITSYHIQYWNGVDWINCVSGTTVGAMKDDSFEEVIASKVRIYISSVSADSVSIHEFEVYHENGPNLATGGPAVTRENANGGKSYFITHANAANLLEALDDALEVYDVEIEDAKSLRYIHKVSEGRSVYYFANLSGASIDTSVRLRGSIVPQVWDPHSGSINDTPEYQHITEGDQTVTRVRLNLPHLRSAFIVDTPPTAAVPPKLEISVNGAEVELSMSNLVQDRHYRITKSTDLSDWKSFDDFIVPGPPFSLRTPDGSVEMTLFDSIGRRAFYQLHEVGDPSF